MPRSEQQSSKHWTRLPAAAASCRFITRSARAEIDSTMIRHQNVLTGFRVNVDCFLRVAVSYYPELEVLLDGKPVQFFETADHFTYIRCPAGPHVLCMRARLGGLRGATLLVSLISLPAVLVLIIMRRRKPKPANPLPERKR